MIFRKIISFLSSVTFHITVGLFGFALAALLVWFHLTNPYASVTTVRQPYSTEIKDGQVTIRKQFQLQAHAGWPAGTVGYVKSGFLIIQNTYFGSRPAEGTSVKEIIATIHRQRFDPSKPYLISGDQFSVLYPRNLGVFYNAILEPSTALDQQDWQNRQRIYLQSALYALDAFSDAGRLTTTIVPISPHGAVLTEVHPGSVPSDSLYGVLYALQALQNTDRYSSPAYRLTTAQATRQIVQERHDDLQRLLVIYLEQVRDPQTGLVKRHIRLASARDGVTRDSSFYDNVVLWKTLSLAHDLGLTIPAVNLQDMRQQILTTFWDDSAGHFIDSYPERQSNPGSSPESSYSSDWLITLPAGFLEVSNKADRTYLLRSIAYIRQNRIDQPLPIAYSRSLATDRQATKEPLAVRTFVSSYGHDAIWSYWGSQYLTMLGQLQQQDPALNFKSYAESAIKNYHTKIMQYHGFPETFDDKGQFLQNIVYKSIRNTGWVVQFELAEQYFPNAKQAGDNAPAI